jgi:hypothetical protein
MQVFKRLKNHFNTILRSQPSSLQSCRTHEAHTTALYTIPFIQLEGEKNKTEQGWDVMPCSLTNKYQQKNGGGSKFLQTLVGIYHTKQHHIPEDCNLDYH